MNTLDRYARNIHSQCGEDGILAELVRRLHGLPHRCVEFGAGDGITYSNTAALLEGESDWTGVMIEADRNKAARCRHRWQDTGRVATLTGKIGWGLDDNLAASLELANMTMGGIGILSIDIDGNDWHAWKALEPYPRPSVVVIEFNPTFPPWVEYVQPADPATNRGASLCAMVRLAHTMQYRLVACSHWNGIFVHERHAPEVAGVALRPDATTRELAAYWWHPEFWSWRAWGYDGQAFHGGLQQSLWPAHGGRYDGALKAGE